MLRISKASTHGVRAIFDMAYYREGAPVAHGNVIAERQGIPPRYLALILIKLKRAGLINSTRGAEGGYCLARSPDEITVGDVIRATEGAVNLVFCIDPSGSKRCGRAQGCVARDVWAEASQRMMRFFDSVTLADLCDHAANAGIPIEEEG